MARHVFPTDEIAHLWAHQTQGDARNSQGNFYFNGKVIYSYRDYYPLANRVENAQGKEAIMMRAAPYYSVTTSKHARITKQSIPSNVVSFEVPSVFENHEVNLAYFVVESKEAFDKATRSRRWGTWLLDDAYAYVEKAEEYAQLFGLTVPDFPHLPDAEAEQDLRIKLETRQVRNAEARKLLHVKKQEQYQERIRIAAMKDAEKIELWKQGNPHAHPPYNAPTMLGVKGNEVETSKGARVPVSHAWGFGIRKEVERFSYVENS